MRPLFAIDDGTAGLLSAVLTAAGLTGGYLLRHYSSEKDKSAARALKARKDAIAERDAMIDRHGEEIDRLTASNERLQKQADELQSAVNRLWQTIHELSADAAEDRAQLVLVHGVAMRHVALLETHNIPHENLPPLLPRRKPEDDGFYLRTAQQRAVSAGELTGREDHKP